jgi:hypothetical protein
MTYLESFVRTTWIFAISGTDEVAQVDLSMAADSPDQVTNTPDETFIEGARDAMENLLATSGLGWATYSKFVGVKTVAVGTTGHYIDEPLLLSVAGEQGSTDGVPPQCCVVLSEWSGETLGIGNYGRLYLPHCLPTFESGTPYMTTTVQAALRDAFADFIGAMNTLGSALTPAAHTKIMTQAASAVVDKTVTHVRVGRLVDTQRRRRNRLSEEYSTVALS